MGCKENKYVTKPRIVISGDTAFPKRIAIEHGHFMQAHTYLHYGGLEKVHKPHMGLK